MDFDKTILIKFSGIWQAAEAVIILDPSGKEKVKYRLNGLVCDLDPERDRYHLFNLLPEEDATKVVEDFNTADMDRIIDSEKERQNMEAEMRLIHYRRNQAARRAD